MTQLYTNNSGVPLSVAVWLASDTYDHSEAGLSVTTLLKPIRQVILGKRAQKGLQTLSDVIDMYASRRGTALHDSIEDSWVNDKRRMSALRALGMNPKVADRIVVNPPAGTDLDGKIPVYLEVRSHKIVNGIKVSGKFDFVAEGRVEDFKSTSTFSYTSGNKDEDYITQGSLYKWLNPDIITADTSQIDFLFTDWQKMRAKADPNYPQLPVLGKAYVLWTVEKAQAFVETKIAALMKFSDAKEEDLPECSDSDLWRSDPVFKYYKNPANNKPGGRSTKNFDNLREANAKLYEDGSVGIVLTVPGQVKACGYCPGFSACTQKDRLIASGDLIL